MKIVHLVTSLDFGGLERRMEILSKYPSSKNKLFFCALGGGGATYNRLREHGSDVCLLNADFRIFHAKTLLILIKYLRTIMPDVLHTHGCEANFYGALAGRLLGIKKIIAEEIGIPNLSPKAKFVFTNIYKLCHSVISMSPIVRDYLENENIVSRNKLALVYNPVLLSKQRKPVPSESYSPIKFIFIGRLEEVKNPLGLLAAFDKLIASGKQAFLTFVGDGSQRMTIEEYVRVKNLEQHVAVTGFSADPLFIARQHDVIVQPSYTEGFSLALVEAMSCGLPAIATPTGSATSLINSGINGWLLKSSTIDDIYDGLLMACKYEKDFYEMGQKAADLVSSKHNPTLYAEKLDDFYAGIVSIK